MTELEHDWFAGQLATYLADGLNAEERSCFEAHARACDACARDLDEARGVEANMKELFAGVMPAGDFEDRIVGQFRARRPRARLKIHPVVRKAAIAAAAAIVMGGVGFVGERVIRGGKMLSPGQIANLLAISQSKIEFQSEARSIPATQPVLVSHGRTVALERGVRTENSEVLAQLGRQLPEVRFDKIALSDAVEFMRDVSGANIFVDWRKLEAAGVNRDTPVTARLKDVKFGDAVGSILSSADGGTGKLGAVVDESVLSISTRNDATIIANQRASRERFDRNVVTQFNSGEEQKIPYSDIMRFPDNWGDRSATATAGAISGRRDLGISGSNGYGLTTGRLSVRDELSTVRNSADLVHSGSKTATVAGAVGTGGDTYVTGGTTGRMTLGGSGATNSVAVNGTSSLTMNGITKTGAGALNLASGTTGFGGVIMNGGAMPNAGILKPGANDELVVWSGGTGAKTMTSDLTTASSQAISMGDGSFIKRGGGVLAVNGGTLMLGSGAVPATPIIGTAGQPTTIVQAFIQQPPNGIASGGTGTVNTQISKDTDIGSGVVVDATVGGKVDINTFGRRQGNTEQRSLERFAQNQQQAGQASKAEYGMAGASRPTAGTVDGIPVLGDMPTVGEMFSRSLEQREIGGGTASFTRLNAPGGTLSVGAGTAAMSGKPGTWEFNGNQTWSITSNWQGGTIATGGGNPVFPSNRVSPSAVIPNSVTFGTFATGPTPSPISTPQGPVFDIQDSMPAAQVTDFDQPSQFNVQSSPITEANSRTQEALAFANTLQNQQPAPAQPPPGGAAVVEQPQVQAQQAPPPAPQPPPMVQVRRVIRNGVMEFEVDSFDSAFAVVTKITAEEGGFVVAADSDRLQNGKVRGMITVRVPPDNLDTLILKLRALGELKSQKLGSTDISKEYTDLESELRAGRAMEERLLLMIKNAQGEVKDLLEAEKELASWRTKLEKIQGQMNYYNNLVSLATLTINAYEKDIRTPATATQSEEINTGIEAEDVDAARKAALKAVDEVKGRIIESSLQQMNAGQFAAKIIAEISPENAGQVVDRLRQIGRVARLDSQKKQTTGAGATQGTSSLGVQPKVETAPTRLIVSIYNLANVAPRLTTNLNLAGDDVETVYRAILKRVNDANGRVVSSNLNKQDANQINGTIQFEVKSADADGVLNDIRQPVQVLRLNVTENPDTANVTTTKQGFTVQIIPTSQVTPRLTTNLNLAAEDVEATYASILNQLRTLGGRVIASNLNRQDATQAVGSIQFEVKSTDADALMNELRKTVQVLTLNVNENTGAANVTTLKQGFAMQIIPAAQVQPREVRSLAVQTSAVDSGIQKVTSAVIAAGGRVLESSQSQDEGGAMIARLALEVPLDKLDSVTDVAKAQGKVRTSEASRNVQVPEGALSRARINLTIGTGETQTIVPQTGGFWDTIRGGLSTSVKGLLWSLQLIIIGLCLVGPWVLMVWGGLRWMKKRKKVTV